MVLSGCSREKVGKLIKLMSKTFGIQFDHEMSRCTVSRAVLEGGVAARIQMAHDHSQSLLGATISQDSTSHRKQNYEAEHIVIKSTDYTGDTRSIDTWKENINEMTDLYNRSPLAQYFLRVLKGMSGDHANNEKATANIIKTWKRTELLEELREKKLAEKEFGDLVLYLASWNIKKIGDAGGHKAWEALPAHEKAQRDEALLKEILADLGQEAYDALSDNDRREIDLFIWAGCCMHKDQNSFKGGNTEMIAEWSKMGVDLPVLLANKANATILQKVFEPGKNLEALSEVQRKAFEDSTRGGVKAMDLAGALFNNKDDKKGQGDIHVNHFKVNTRFGSHGLAACEIVKYLDAYVEFVKTDIPFSKSNPSRTNIEENLLRALEDIPTITELCVMVLYTNIISHPYMRVVRGPGTNETNALDLGPLHAEVQLHIQKLLDNDQLIFGEDASHTTSTLDGREWEDEKAVNVVFKLSPKLPHLRPITAAFFQGALATWIRFSSEFAPGGLIDEATASEWHYRVTVQGKPTLTLHQYNAEAMYSRNNTLAFMNALFEDADYEYIMREARRIDASGLEKKRRVEQMEFRRRVVQMNKEKEEAKKKKAVELHEKLKKIPLIWDLSELDSIPRPELDPKVPIPVKSKVTRLDQKQEAFKIGFGLYLEKLAELGREWPGTLGDVEAGEANLRIEEEWHEREEMDN
ncbi:hypothetical protein K435DRAFT_819917 [Dendrothele bispora CBS 962.96]|uniref:Uncharacterized protein n=1 Tax=Dendrothele bispora (strain CBS 962.96) TaxID=1314807 RepID=A0A4S8LYZ0_DENBC|nr:hypothetical protein K435DRAFT_819917 [Dendrothele bispora CBS 962.96]